VTETEPVADTQELQDLQGLLGDLDRNPLELAEEIRRRRQALTDDLGLERDLDRLELRFLERQARRKGVDQGVRDDVARMHQVALERTRRCLKLTSGDNPAALFDLAEVRAAFLHEGMQEAADRVRGDQEARLVDLEIGDPMVVEARERFAAIVTDEEDLDLDHRIHLMRETAWVMTKLLERSNRRIFRKLSRRLRQAAGDRQLALRMEKVLTRRGVTILENASLMLLLVVFVLLAIQGTIAFDPQADREMLRKFILIDGSICLFFIAEFTFKIVLAPHRMSWFVRNVLIDLLPAVPAAILLMAPMPGTQEVANVAAFRALRFFRVVIIARYIHMLRPLISFARLLLFLIRGLDAVVERFSPLLNRNFYFFEGGVVRQGDEAAASNDRRHALFQAIRREHVLVGDAAVADASPVVSVRATALRERMEHAPDVQPPASSQRHDNRDIPVEHAIDRLHTLRPEELNLVMSHADLLALDRVVRVINAPVIRSLPFIRWVRSPRMGSTPESRVTDLGRRIADQLELWRGRILFFADLQGIVTGPQILDRIATAMVKASQRPAVRLLLFGALFSVFRMLLGEESAVGDFLKKFVATPLVIIGGLCLVVLALGRWLKRLAGEASEHLKRTSEAHFINLLELLKTRTRESDMAFLAKRIFRWEMDHWEAALALNRQVHEATSGVVAEGPEPGPPIQEDINRVALMYLHFLDGAILHESDIKTTEQLLANLSLENIRSHHLRFTRRDHKRVRKLSLMGGSILSGPYLWFRFITEYNRHCLSLQQRQVATADEVRHMQEWLSAREAETEGRILEKVIPPHEGAAFRTTEFNALNFLSLDKRRDEQIAKTFGEDVLAVLRKDRRNMIREIFGTKPLHELPRSQRTVNFFVFYRQKLSRGRVLLLPFLFVVMMFRFVKMILAKTTSIVREILQPEISQAKREKSHAAFAVALRKIHRMKAPGLLEAMRMRSAFDPAYCGAPPTWSFGMKVEDPPELERDMDFLQMRAREREGMRELAATNRRRVEELRRMVRGLDFDVPAAVESEMERRFGERAVTIAYMTDREGMRSLFRAEQWLERELPMLESPQTRIAAAWLATFLAWCRRGFRSHPVNRLIRTHVGDRHVSWRGRRNLRRAYLHDLDGARTIVHTWLSLPPGAAPSDHARNLVRKFFRAHGEVSRELVALRAVQTLSVLDVRNYREAVFRLGGFEQEGEDPELASAVP
jgi:hypothetical protein